jgi:hypothetical protein
LGSKFNVHVQSLRIEGVRDVPMVSAVAGIEKQ